MLALIAGICGDMGMCVVYLFIFAVMAWGAGVKKRWFLLAGSAIVIGFSVLWIFILPNTAAWDSLYLVKRFRVLFDHSFDPQGIGFQQTRSILALGSGQVFGKGYLHGSMTQSGHASTLPARHTDFIFAVCGEELGMVGCLALLLCWRLSSSAASGWHGTPAPPSMPMWPLGWPGCSSFRSPPTWGCACSSSL